MELTHKTVVEANAPLGNDKVLPGDALPGDANTFLGIDIGSTTVKIAILDQQHHILFSDQISQPDRVVL